MFLATDAFGNNFALTSVPNTIKRGQEVADYHHDSPSLPQNVRKRAPRSPRGRLVAPIWPFKRPNTPQVFEVRGQFWSLLACRMENLAQETVNMMSTPGWKTLSCHKMASTCF